MQKIKTFLRNFNFMVDFFHKIVYNNIHEGRKGMKKLSKDEKRILKEDIQGLQYLIKMYTKEGKFSKAADCQKELDEIKLKLKEGK